MDRQGLWRACSTRYTRADAILHQHDNMAQPSQRKLTALALASLLPSQRPIVLECLPEVVSLWSSVLAETEENESGEYVVATLTRLPPQMLIASQQR